MRASHRRVKPPQAWPPVGGPYRDERLAFLAISPRLKKRDLRRGLFRTIIADMLSSDFVHTKAHGHAWRPRQRHIAFACEEAAAELDALERQRLRLTGELPDWFFLEVKRLARRAS